MQIMKKWDRLDLIYIVIIIVFAVVIQLFFISPPIMSDDMEYYFCATKFPHMPNPPSHWSLRIGLILPVAILYRIFGHAEIVYYTIPFISIVLLSCGTYWLGSRLFNQRLGVISALWLVTTPNLLTESSLLLPDIPATACITIGFGMLASLAKETPNKISKSTKNQKAIWYFLTGMCFGWGYLIKEYYILFIPIILCFFILFELSWKQAIQLFMGMVAVFGFESILNLILYDNPFVRLMTAEPRETQGFIERDVWTVISYFPTLIKGHGGWSHLLLCTIGFVTMLTGFFRKNKKFTFLASWFLLLYIFFTIVGLLPIMFS